MSLEESSDALVADPVAPLSAQRTRLSSWCWWLVGITGGGLLIRVLAVLGRPHRISWGDNYYYWTSARLLVEGKWWIDPYLYTFQPGHPEIKSAQFPPLFVCLMAVPHALGLHTFLEARLWCCLLGAGAIVLVAFATREIAGPRTALVAAFLVAIYPNLWMSSDSAISETITPVLVAWILWMTYRFWKNPCVRTSIWLGVSMGIAMLGRDELALLTVLIFLPLALLLRQLTIGDRLKLLAIGAVTVALVISPWVIFNLSRFDRPVVISTGLGVTLASANCDPTYSGLTAGYWNFTCAEVRGVPVTSTTDESVASQIAQDRTMRYIRAHLGQLPQVELDRLGRTFGLFRPAQQIYFDATIESRPYHWAMLSLAMYYVLLAASLVGTWVLRTRRILVFPLWSVGLGVICSTLLTFGQTRYRTPFEVSLVILSSVAYVWGYDRLRHRPIDLPELVEPVVAEDVAQVGAR